MKHDPSLIFNSKKLSFGLEDWCFHSCKSGGFTHLPWFLHGINSEKQLERMTNRSSEISDQTNCWKTWQQTTKSSEINDMDHQKFMPISYNFSVQTKFHGTIFLKRFLLRQRFFISTSSIQPWPSVCHPMVHPRPRRLTKNGFLLNSTREGSRFLRDTHSPTWWWGLMFRGWLRMVFRELP